MTNGKLANLEANEILQNLGALNELPPLRLHQPQPTRQR
jgi:hypothetical protein